MLTLLRVLVLLSTAGDARPLELGRRGTFHVKQITATADGPFCLSLIEQRGAVRRALSLACYGPGESRMVFDSHQSTVMRHRGDRYLLVAFAPPAADATPVIVNAEILKE